MLSLLPNPINVGTKNDIIPINAMVLPNITNARSMPIWSAIYPVPSKPIIDGRSARLKYIELLKAYGVRVMEK